MAGPLDNLLAKHITVGQPVAPAAPEVSVPDISNIENKLLEANEMTLLETQIMPQEFNNVEQPLHVADQQAMFQQAITFMHSALEQNFDAATCQKSIAQIMQMLKQVPQLEEVLLPEDVGAMIRMLEKNYNVVVVQKREGTQKRKTAKQRREAGAAQATGDLQNIMGKLGVSSLKAPGC